MHAQIVEPDYTDCVRNLRESAHAIEELCGKTAKEREQLDEVTRYLEQTAARLTLTDRFPAKPAH